MRHWLHVGQCYQHTQHGIVVHGSRLTVVLAYAVDLAYIGHDELLIVLERHWPEVSAQKLLGKMKQKQQD
eukprot:COSAG05_NODE_15250_length_374_cov_1.109091_1_plen_69_part_10